MIVVVDEARTEDVQVKNHKIVMRLQHICLDRLDLNTFLEE